MEQLKQIFEYISSGFSLLVFLFTALMFIVNKINKKHRRIEVEEEKEAIEENLNEEQARFKLINEVIPVAIAYAEKLTNLTGEAKKTIALSNILLECNERNIDFNKFIKFIDEQLENLITFTKKINKRAKDVEKE